MNQEIKAYLRIEATVAAAFNFFINGMIAGLIYHKVDLIPFDTVSIAVDLFLTCFFTFLITAFFCRASLKRTKTYRILKSQNDLIGLLSRLFRYPALFGVLLGVIAGLAFFIPIAVVFSVLQIKAVPFGGYALFKTVFCALLGYGVTLLELYSGMCGNESIK